MEHDYVQTVTLLLVLLNPFALSVYLFEILREHPVKRIAGLLIRAAVIAGVVFFCFAIAGERLLTDLLHVRFFTFQIFGGVIFLLIGVKFVMQGASALTLIRGEPEQLAGTVAMPFLIGPGTISASALAGVRLGPVVAFASIAGALLVTVGLLLGLKLGFDQIRQRNALLLERYAEAAGRVSGVIAGTMSLEMIASGVEGWLRAIRVIS